MNLLDDIFPTGYHMPKIEIVCKSYDPGKLMYPHSPSGPTCLLVLHLLGLGFFMSKDLYLLLNDKKSWRNHCKVLRLMHIAATSLLRD